MNPLISKLTGSPWFAPTAIFFGALFLFSINLDRPPHPDELHHVLAGQHLLETGRPIIVDGEYWRGILYTWLVAVSYEVFGDSLSSARLPAVLLVALVAPIVFVWVRREAGAIAAWSTAFFFITSPFIVEIAQFSRFYSLQMLFFTTGSICIFQAFAANESSLRRAALTVLALVLLALSAWVQETTFIGIAGIGVWLTGVVVVKLFRGLTQGQASRRALFLAVIGAGLIFLLAMVLSDELTFAWSRYRAASLFAAEHANEFWFYHIRYLLLYPTLWPLIGVLAIFAAIRHPRLIWFAVSVFGVSFLLTSFAAQKATRYFSYVQPLLAIVWGVGLACVLPALFRKMELTRTRLAELLAFPTRTSAGVARVLVTTALAIVVLMNPFWLRTAAIIGNVPMPMESPVTDWRAARDALAPWTTGAEIVITTEELGALYFLGRSDVRFSQSKFHELPPDQRFEFGIDRRTGRPIIAKPESLKRLIDCFQRGLVVGPIEHWGSPILISKDVQAILLEQARPIEIPKESHLYAWGWAREGRESRPSYCSDLDRFSGMRDTR